MKKTVAIALSGGVDSLVAAHLLKKQGHHLFGIHFINGYESQETRLEKIESQLNIPVKYIQLKDVFEKKVVQYFIDTYLKGLTPNPCLICNQAIKFGALHEAAARFGATAMATGHYARLEIMGEMPSDEFTSKDCSAGAHLTNEGSYTENLTDKFSTDIFFSKKYALLRGIDKKKEQSYFLSMLTRKQLANSIFPLGNLTKKEVVCLAEKKRTYSFG